MLFRRRRNRRGRRRAPAFFLFFRAEPQFFFGDGQTINENGAKRFPPPNIFFAGTPERGSRFFATAVG
jgi:hypothetical protein